MFLDSRVTGCPLSVAAVARLTGVPVAQVQGWHDREQWADAATVLEIANQADRWAGRAMLQPLIAKEVGKAVAPAQEAVVEAGTAAARAEVTRLVDPIVQVLEDHRSRLDRLARAGERLLDLALEALPTGEEEAEDAHGLTAWEPAEILRALELSKSISLEVTKSERLLHGLPTSYHASKSSVDAKVAVSGVGELRERIRGKASVSDMARALAAQGVPIDLEGVEIRPYDGEGGG